MPKVTAQYSIDLPFITVQVEGVTYDKIILTIDADTTIKLFPLEYRKALTPSKPNTSVAGTRTLTIELTFQVDDSQTDSISTRTKENIEKILNTYLNKFISHCRAETKQYWWHPIFLRDFNLQTVIFYKKFINTNTGNVISEHPSTGGGIPPVGCGINQARWNKVKHKLEHEIDPGIIDFYIEEARSAIFSKNIELMVVNTAIAEEIYSSRFWANYAKKHHRDSDPRYITLRKKSIGRAQKNFRKYPDLFVKKDLFHENRILYDSIDNLFQTRNKIVHEGSAYYNTTISSVYVDYSTAHRFFLDAKEAMSWLQKIDRNVAEDIYCLD